MNFAIRRQIIRNVTGMVEIVVIQSQSGMLNAVRILIPIMQRGYGNGSSMKIVLLIN